MNINSIYCGNKSPTVNEESLEEEISSILEML